MFRIRYLKKSYKKNKVLDIKSYDFENTGLYIIVGPNGSGKTTLLKALTNQIKYEGEIYFNNINIKDYKNDLLKKVCYVPQFNTLFNNMNTRENLNYNNMFLNKELNYNDKNKSHNIIKHMSGGQKKNANLERFLSLDYECLILDEPTTSLDKYNKNRLLEYIKENKEIKLIICVTHDEDLIELADKKIDINNIEISKEEFDIQNYKYKKIKEPFKFKEFFSYLFEGKVLLIFRFICLTFFIVALFLFLSILSFDGKAIVQSYAESNLVHADIETDDSNLPSTEYDLDDIIDGDSRYDCYRIDTTSLYLRYDDKGYNFCNGYDLIFSNEIDDVEISDYLAESWFGTEDANGYDIELYWFKTSNPVADVSISSVISTDYTKYSYLNSESNWSPKERNRAYLLVSSKYFYTITNMSNYSGIENDLENFTYVTFDFNLKGDDFYDTFTYEIEDIGIYYNGSSYVSNRVTIGEFFLDIIMAFSIAILIYISIVDMKNNNKKIKKKAKLKIYSASEKYIYSTSLLQDVFLGITSLVIGFVIGYVALYYLNNLITTPDYLLITGKTFLNIVYYPVFIILLLYVLFIGYKLLIMRKK